ncbi:MAG: BrnT family toxin [Acidobacteriia bacterium]|nr:BrnT family toxin [Terriglobia bacterium]MYC67999.1 BrnT family toxin [Terriglobia bacterium]MYG03498.1 BrnT family toxin [Terriglobia bacterium]MYK09016.1 BrnT family toxin [Terriglobia bacterium]
MLQVEFDPAKRKATLDARGLDMVRADGVFDGATLRNDRHQIISMRKANEREQALSGPRLGS